MSLRCLDRNRFTKVLLGLAHPVLSEETRPCPLAGCASKLHVGSRGRCRRRRFTPPTPGVYSRTSSAQLEAPGRRETMLRDRVFPHIAHRNSRPGATWAGRSRKTRCHPPSLNFSPHRSRCTKSVCRSEPRGIHGAKTYLRCHRTPPECERTAVSGAERTPLGPAAAISPTDSGATRRAARLTGPRRVEGRKRTCYPL